LVVPGAGEREKPSMGREYELDGERVERGDRDERVKKKNIPGGV
jgi:hypothetical protein